MKIHKKLLTIILLLLILIQAIPFNLWAINSIQTESNKSYISALKVKEVIDGLEPFDDDNNIGNDKDSNNKVVRSFDNINYTLEYVTALKTSNPVTDGYLMVEFILPYTSDIATFDMNTMTWLIEPNLKEINGTQVLTGKRYLQNNSTNNAIPGAGTLSAGLKVGAAPNGTLIQPTFKLWMEGNDSSESKSITSEKITVTAAPKYNVRIQKHNSLDYLGYFNESTGNESNSSDKNALHGRMQGYGITLQMYNDSASKGLKGIEIPRGNISFDLTLEEKTESSNDLTLTEGWTPIIWDYKNNDPTDVLGQNGRTMNWRNNWNNNYALAAAPFNELSLTNDPGASCYNGGNWSMTKTGKTTYRVTVSDYEFNYDWNTYPLWEAGTSQYESNKVYYDNQYSFSAGYFQILTSFPPNANDDEIFRDVYLTVKASNFTSKSITNQTGIDNNPSDDIRTNAITLMPPGTIIKDIRLNNQSGGSLNTPYYEANASLFAGDSFDVSSCLSRKTDYIINSFNYLLKFDDKGFEPSNSSSFRQYTEARVSACDVGTTKFTYAAKKDKVGWNSYTEMWTKKQKDLVFFDSYEQLKNNGYVCVGVLAENTGSKLWPGSFENFAFVHIALKVKDNANINETYGMVSDFNLTEEGQSENPYFDTTYYKKTEYDGNGNIIVGTHAGGHYQGQTVLVVGNKTNITTGIADTSKDGSVKTTYDMDKNERTINYELKPNVSSPSTSESVTNLYIETTLPKDLTYNKGSSFYQNNNFEPEIITNSDGTTSLKWKLSNIYVNKDIDKIKFNCTIGKAGTNSDVINNQIITIDTKIRSDEDNRVALLTNGNRYQTSFNIIKLNAISIIKTTNTPFINIGEKFNYNFKFANNSENKITNSKLYDILPYNKDSRNSKFSGSYKINSIKLDFKNAPKSFDDYINKNYALQYTDNPEIQSSDFKIISSFNKWDTLSTKTIDNTNKIVIFNNIPQNIKGLLINTSLEGFEYIEVILDLEGISVDGQTQKEGDVYVNDIYQYSDGQVQQVHSNQAAVQILGKLNITKIWQDDNNKYNTRPSKIKITLYQNNNIYKNIELTNSNELDKNHWQQIVKNIPLYDNEGKPYSYTIKENEDDQNLQYFYNDPIYEQEILTVTNRAIYVPVKPEEKPLYKITIIKDIVNKSNTISKEDFDKINLNINNVYNFKIILKELNKNIINTGTELKETYQGYSGKIYNGIVTNKNSLIFNNIPAGKYEISEEFSQYFSFINFVQMSSSSNNAKLINENNKYYIEISSLTGKSENIDVKVKNLIDGTRPYDDTLDKSNKFKQK